MKKLVLILVLSMIVMTAVGCAAEKESAAIVNPVVETDAEGFVQKMGIELGIPDGAENVRYSIIAETLGQVSFTLGSEEFNARVQPAAEFTDISGMYYTWDSEEDCDICQRTGKLLHCVSDGKEIEVCLWYDVVPGLMYSLSAEGADLDGFDITAIAEQVFIPMQGEAG